MRFSTKISPVVIILAAACTLSQSYGQSRYYKEIPIPREEVVNVNLEAAFGTVNLAGGALNKLLIANMSAEPSIDLRTDIEYKISGKTGILALGLKPVEGQKRTWGLRGFETGTWDLQFSKEMPLIFNIEMGAGRGMFDFTGIQLRKLNMSTGASSVVIRFDKPNEEYIEKIHIESGVSRFSGEKLGNANFGELIFEGGVGSYTLDFDGELRHEAHVSISLGIGAVTLIIPEHVGVKLFTQQQRLFSSVDVPEDFERVERNEYVSRNFDAARGKLIIKVESGLGSVRVRR